MVKLVFNGVDILYTNVKTYTQIINTIENNLGLNSSEFYLLHNGKKLSSYQQHELNENCRIQCYLRQVGGKGGFGSMLRAIGAQIEKTTNREACRDLSGRRLRDINEEKRLKAWLEKQAQREREAEERKKRKIEKLLAVPKHDFKDEEYEEARSKLTEKVNDAVEEGFKKAEQAKKPKEEEDVSAPSCSKRPAEGNNAVKTKKKRPALWIGDDIDSTDSDSSENEDSPLPIKSS